MSRIFTKPFAGLMDLARLLWRDRQGATYIFVALTLIPLAGFIGIATDSARGYLVKAKLSQALDAAALAGAQVRQDPVLLKQHIEKYFAVNFPPGYMNARLEGPSYTVDAENDTILLTARATIDTSLMRLLGFRELKVSAVTEVTRANQILEVVLAIDMSGSMGRKTAGVRRIDAATDAADDLVAILFGNSEVSENLKIAVVPWNGKVNVTRNGGAFDDDDDDDDDDFEFDDDDTRTESVPAFTNPLTGAMQNRLYFANNSVVPLLRAPQEDWKGCVFSRFIDDGDDATDADTSYGFISTPAGDWLGWEPVSEAHEPEDDDDDDDICTGSSSGKQCTPCLRHGITPLQSDRKPIEDAINELNNPEGTTNIAQGLGWAWRVLRPEAPFTEAEVDPDGERIQAIVLLTDGEHWGGEGDGYKASFGLGRDAQPEMDARLRRIANAAKAQGVLVYTIQFANGQGNLSDLMREVASDPDGQYYHFAPDADALRQVFKRIANNLSQLRLSM